MHIQKCHFCNAPIYPGEKRCGVTIRIYPDQDEDFQWEEEGCPGCLEECVSEACGWEEGEGPEEFFQEAHLVLCKECQDQFLANPSLKENLIFLRREVHQKTLH